MAEPTATAEAPQRIAAQRIAKVLARAGLCSRRDAERWIAEGRVSVDGEVLQSPAFNVTDASRIEVDGKPLPVAERPRLWRYHKPIKVLPPPAAKLSVQERRRQNPRPTKRQRNAIRNWT